MAKIINALVAVLAISLGGSLGWIVPALAQPRPSAPPAAGVPADPWPRQVKVVVWPECVSATVTAGGGLVTISEKRVICT